MAGKQQPCPSMARTHTNSHAEFWLANGPCAQTRTVRTRGMLAAVRPAAAQPSSPWRSRGAFGCAGSLPACVQASAMAGKLCTHPSTTQISIWPRMQGSRQVPLRHSFLVADRNLLSGLTSLASIDGGLAAPRGQVSLCAPLCVIGRFRCCVCFWSCQALEPISNVCARAGV